MWKLAAVVVCVMLLCCFTNPGHTQPQDKKEPDVKMSERSKAAVQKGLKWLASKQNKDGSWSESRFPHNTAITAFAALAFMSNGHVPGQGEFGPNVANAGRFLISSPRKEDGYLIGRGGNMYCHGMATLALAELYGMSQDEQLKPVLQRAVELIVRTQHPLGGWRYEPQPYDADISATIIQVMALRAAKNGGLNVPDAVMEKAIKYVLVCRDEDSGGFNYQPGQRRPGFARTAAGACVLQLCGKYDADAISGALKYMKKDFIERRQVDKDRNNFREHFWYGHYYAAHAMHTIGGQDWAVWYKEITDLLHEKQSANGAWDTTELEGNTPGPVYQTSIAILVLSTPLGYLPIYQR